MSKVLVALLATAILLCPLLAYNWWLGRELTSYYSTSTAATWISPSLAESKSRGMFIDHVTITPKVINWRGNEIAFKEAWLEHSHELNRVDVIIPHKLHVFRYRKSTGYTLCLDLTDSGWEALGRQPRPFFVLKGRGNGFGNWWKAVLYDYLDTLEFEQLEILATDNWKFTGAQALQVRRGP